MRASASPREASASPVTRVTWLGRPRRSRRAAIDLTVTVLVTAVLIAGVVDALLTVALLLLSSLGQLFLSGRELGSAEPIRLHPWLGLPVTALGWPPPLGLAPAGTAVATLTGYRCRTLRRTVPGLIVIGAGALLFIGGAAWQAG